MDEHLLWEKVLKRVKEEVYSLVYITWFEPTKLRIVDDKKAIILVPSKIHKKHLFDNYYGMIIDYLLNETNEIDEVLFTIESEEYIEDKEEYVARHAIKIYIV